jgi:hypothetical protein
MGGESSQKTTQESTTQPWLAAQPAVQGLLGKLSPLIANSGVNQTQTNALNNIEANAAAGNPYAPAIGATTTNLLNGGGATNEAGNINGYYDQYLKATQPLASNTDYNPYNTPGFKDALGTTVADITNGTNGTFAAAGRDFSGANSMALGRGIMQGVAPTIAAQYNQNVQNQQGAANNLLQAGNTRSGLLSGLNQQGLMNQQAGAGLSNDALSANNYGASTTLAAEAQRTGIPIQTLGLLANIGIPIAGLGSQSTGQSDTTKQMSGVEQFMGITSGLSNLFGGASGGGSVAGMAKFLSDRRAKRDIQRVGSLHNGLGVYTFRYIWDDPKTYIGVMAQEVLNVMPEAVLQIGDYLAVDYGMVLEGT